TLATMDHNVPTNDEPPEPISAKQIEAMARNAREFGIRCFPMGSPEQGIVHVISPQLGLTQPGMTIVCGDSHTSTHGALGALAWEGRLTISNMSIEAGARAGIVGPDNITFAWLEGRPYAPKGQHWEKALDDWRSLATDPDARFDREVKIDARRLRPYVTWGTN